MLVMLVLQKKNNLKIIVMSSPCSDLAKCLYIYVKFLALQLFQGNL